MNNFYVFPVLLVSIHDCLKRLWKAVEHREIYRALSAPHAHSPVGHARTHTHSHLCFLCRLVSNYVHCCASPTIVFFVFEVFLRCTTRCLFGIPTQHSARRDVPSRRIYTPRIALHHIIIIIISSSSSSFVHSFQNPALHYIDCEYTSMYLYTIHMHSCAENIRVDRARARIEANGKRGCTGGGQHGRVT